MMLDKGYSMQDFEKPRVSINEYLVLTHHGSILNPELPVSGGVCFKQSQWGAVGGGTQHMRGGQHEGGHRARTWLMRLGQAWPWWLGCSGGWSHLGSGASPSASQPAAWQWTRLGWWGMRLGAGQYDPVWPRQLYVYKGLVLLPGMLLTKWRDDFWFQVPAFILSAVWREAGWLCMHFLDS